MQGASEPNLLLDAGVTRDQFAEVFGNQSAAAGAPGVWGTNGAPSGSSAPTKEANADTATVAEDGDNVATSSPAAANEPAVAQHAQNASEPEEVLDDTLLVDTPAAEAPAPEVDTAVEAPPEPANDNEAFPEATAI